MELVSRHQCLIYDGSPSMQLPNLAGIAIGKLRANNRCLYLNSPAMVAGFRSYLAAAGLDVADEVKKGALVLSSDQSHLVDGRFDPDRMVGQLFEAVNQSLQDGYAGLWATGDMLWEFGSERNFEKLLEYELALEELLQENPFLGGVCQYHKDILPPDAVGVALDTHQTVYVNEILSRVNPFFRARSAGENHLQAGGVGEMLDRLQLRDDY